MLAIVAERLLRCAQRHLDEAKGWIEIAEQRNDLFAKRYANKKTEWHLDMARYWQMAANNLHYVPGTWAYKF